jgi:hypothetical protein
MLRVSDPATNWRSAGKARLLKNATPGFVSTLLQMGENCDGVRDTADLHTRRHNLFPDVNFSVIKRRPEKLYVVTPSLFGYQVCSVALIRVIARTKLFSFLQCWVMLGCILQTTFFCRCPSPLVGIRGMQEGGEYPLHVLDCPRGWVDLCITKKRGTE